MRKSLRIIGGLAVVGLMLATGFNSPQAQGPLGRPGAWADCESFRTVVAPAAFDPAAGPFDELYKNPNGYRNGLPLISDSKPGDQDYNGGRWHLNLLRDDVPAGKYSDACSIDDLDLADFESMDVYFECPLLPTGGGR